MFLSIVSFRFCAGSSQSLKKQLFTSNCWFPLFGAQSFFNFAIFYFHLFVSVFLGPVIFQRCHFCKGAIFIFNDFAFRFFGPIIFQRWFFCKGAIFHFQQCASVFLNPSYFSNYPNLLFLFLWAQSFHNNPSIVFFRFCAGSGQFLKKQLFTSNSWFPFFEAQSFFIWGPLPFTRRGLEGGA